MPGQDERELFVAERPVLVGEADAAVQLGVAGQPLVDPGHADEKQPEGPAVEAVPQVLQGLRRQAVGLVDDKQVNVVRLTAGAQPDVVAVHVVVDAPLDPGEQLVEVPVELADRVRGRRGVEDGAGAGQAGVDRVVAVVVWPPLLEQRLGLVPGGVPAGRQRLADPGRRIPNGLPGQVRVGPAGRRQVISTARARMVPALRRPSASSAWSSPNVSTTERIFPEAAS